MRLEMLACGGDWRNLSTVIRAAAIRANRTSRGGETLSATVRLAGAGLPVIAVPGTIGNDIPGTDCPFGFDTAPTAVMRAVAALHGMAESHDQAVAPEAMDHGTGWLGVCAGIGGRPNVVMAPEEPVSIAGTCDSICHRTARARVQPRRRGGPCRAP